MGMAIFIIFSSLIQQLLYQSKVIDISFKMTEG